jgi:ATP adenylyltransferase
MLDAADDAAHLILHRGELAFLVLNKYPYNNGHLMAVPYRHVDTLETLTAEETASMMALVTLGMQALRRSAQPHGFNIGVNIGKTAGAGVLDHVHTHIVPRWEGDANFMPVLADVRLIPQDLHETYADLRAAIKEIRMAPDNVWAKIGSLCGQTLLTLDQGQPFDVVAATEQSLIIRMHATGKERRIRRAEIEEAAKHLFSKKEITRAEIRDKYSEANPAYVAALLAALDGVQHTNRPIHLRYIP